MRNEVGVSQKGKPWRRITPVGTRRKCRGNIEQFLLCEPNKRAAHEGAERQRIASIGQRAYQREKILSFLSPEEPLAGLRCDRQPLLLESPFVAPQFGAGWCEKRDIGRRERHSCAIKGADFQLTDDTITEPGHGKGLRLSDFGEARLGRKLDDQFYNAGDIPFGRRNRRFKCDISGLTWTRKRHLKTPVDMCQYARPRPEICCYVDDIRGRYTPYRCAGLAVRSNIGTAEPVDRLLRVADHE
jgi:hypothetical protein